MFGYHDSDRCMFDLWSPCDDTVRHSHFDFIGYPHATENRAFSPYCKHTTELERIITVLIDNARVGIMDVTIDTDEFLSESDWEYIREEVQKRL